MQLKAYKDCPLSHSMAFSGAYHWLLAGDTRIRIIVNFTQPLTATQLANKARLRPQACRYSLVMLRLRGIVTCFNPDSQYNHVYWLTDCGIACQRKVRITLGLPSLSHDFPALEDWDLFAFVSYPHRSAVIKALRGTMQPPAIKRRATVQTRRLRMSTDNVRDVVRVLRDKGIVRPVRIRKRAHLRYELTDLGMPLQQLLHRADAFGEGARQHPQS